MDGRNSRGPAPDQYQKGDAVEFRFDIGHWLIKDVLYCTDANGGTDAYRWVEYELDPVGEGNVRWLVVEFDDGEWVATLFDRRVDLNEIGYRRGDAFPESLVLNETDFALEESGRMTVSKTNSTIVWRGTYADYAAGDGQWVSIETYPDPTHTPRETEVEVWAGRDIDLNSIEFYLQESPQPRQGLLVSGTYSSDPAGQPGDPLHQALRPAQRRYEVLNPGAQRGLRMAAGVGAVVVIILLLLLLL